MRLGDIRASIATRRTKIFLLMEEVRRLRIQESLKSLEAGVGGAGAGGAGAVEDVAEKEFSSVIPMLPLVSEQTIKNYYVAFGSRAPALFAREGGRLGWEWGRADCAKRACTLSASAPLALKTKHHVQPNYSRAVVAAIIVFGGVVAPVLEVKIGLGGVSYREWIASLGLPIQLSEVDPIVASFCGGAVGVLSALLMVEVKNVEDHAKRARAHLTPALLVCFLCVLGCSELIASTRTADPPTSAAATARARATWHAALARALAAGRSFAFPRWPPPALPPPPRTRRLRSRPATRASDARRARARARRARSPLLLSVFSRPCAQRPPDQRTPPPASPFQLGR